MENKNNQKDKKRENRTIEELLKELRESKHWSYLNLIDELYKKGLNVDEKIVKKWEIGLEYPDLDTIYLLSELYMIPSEDLIIAKQNSFDKACNSIHMTLIKWICYIFGFSYKVGFVIVTIFYIMAYFLALMAFAAGVENLKYL